MLNYIIPIVIVLGVSIIFSVVYKDKTKTDKGFEFFYYRLSYRRKMIRTLTIFPVIALICIIIFAIGEPTTQAIVLFIILFLVGTAIQFFYNFYMWKKYEQV